MSLGAPALARPVIPPERYGARLETVRERLREAGAKGLLVGPGAELVYLAGYEAMALERLTMLVVPAHEGAALIVPRLEREPAEASPAARAGLAAIRTWEETEDPYRLVAAALQGGGAVRGGGPVPRGTPTRLYVGDRLWAMFVVRLRAVFPAADFALASELLRPLRMRKDAEEVALLRLAARAADRVVAAVAAGPLVGRTERDVAREVIERLVAEGHDHAEHPQIVGSGPNSASPHHTASDRVIRAGEPVVLDIGGSLGGYASDITRTVWVAGPAETGPDPSFRAIHDAVQRAHAAAMSVARPGTACEAVDAAARSVIAAAGHGADFLHRTGHGIGLEVHEDPYIVGGNGRPLEPGMAFSIEPGIYLEGRYGVRIEDIVVCTADGPDVLNEAPRELMVVAG
jgi:Xaa-Pro aminopeptidase